MDAPPPAPCFSAALHRRFNYDERSALLLLLPVLLVLAVVAVYPILHALYTSLFDINLTRPQLTPFVGLGNYARVLDDPRFWVAVRRTTVYTVVTVATTAAMRPLPRIG